MSEKEVHLPDSTGNGKDGNQQRDNSMNNTNHGDEESNERREESSGDVNMTTEGAQQEDGGSQATAEIGEGGNTEIPREDDQPVPMDEDPADPSQIPEDPKEVASDHLKNNQPPHPQITEQTTNPPVSQADDLEAEGDLNEDDEDGFDPDTIANLAALSKLAGDEDDDLEQGEDGIREGGIQRDEEAEEEEEELFSTQKGLTKEQVQALVASLRAGAARSQVELQIPEASVSREDSQVVDKESEVTGKGDGNKRPQEDEGGRDTRKESKPPSSPLRVRASSSQLGEGEDSGKEGGAKEDDDEEYRGSGDDESRGKKRKKRHRTVLSCTECHRRCDRNIPCSRCIKRGIASLCKMEHPVLPTNKRRRVIDEDTTKYELGLRVSALEALIRNGSNMDAETASAAAEETVRHATKAANMGNLQASDALASLSSVAAINGDGNPNGEPSVSLMEVLQQLAAASSSSSEDISKRNGAGNSGKLDQLRDIWSVTPNANSDPLNAINQAYENDTDPSKMHLALPGFREDSGNIFIPPSMKYAQNAFRTREAIFKEPLPITGYQPFLEEATKLAYGKDTPQFKKGLITSIQAPSPSGALRIAATFIAKFPQTLVQRAIYVPTPLLEEDERILKESGLEVRKFRYLDVENGGVYWEGLKEDLTNSMPRSAVLIYVSGSVPTGAELLASQWRQLSTIIQERQLIPLCVMAFQGLGSGDPNKDAQPLRFMIHEGLPVVLCQSFEATMGVFADPVSVVSITAPNHEAKERISSQLKGITRSYFPVPSLWGSYIVYTILSDQRLYSSWLTELKAMSGRLGSVRDKLHDVLVHRRKTPGDWKHIKRATGMYCTTLLPADQLLSLTQDRHVHLLPDGSLSLGCLNAPRIDSLTKSIDYVVLEGQRKAEEARQAALALEAALQAAREKAAAEAAEAAEKAAKEAEEAARLEEIRLREEDQRLMEASIMNAMQAQQAAEEEELLQEEERREMNEAIKKAAERDEIRRKAEEILASIGMAPH